MSKYFPKLKSLGANELNLSNYVTKADFKNAAGVDMSSFPKKTDLTHLECDIDKLDIDKSKNGPSCFSSLKSELDKLETTPVDLSQSSGVLENKVNKETIYNE